MYKQGLSDQNATGKLYGSDSEEDTVFFESPRPYKKITIVQVDKVYIVTRIVVCFNQRISQVLISHSIVCSTILTCTI